LSLSTAAIVIFALITALVVRPIADDYCYVVSVKDSGLWGFTIAQSQGWSGALLKNLLDSLFGSVYIFSFQLAYLAFFLVTLGLLTAVFTRALLAAIEMKAERKLDRFVTSGIAIAITYVLAGFGVPATLASSQFAFGYANFTWAASVVSQFIPILAFILLSTLLISPSTQLVSRRTRALLLIGSILVPLLSLQAGVSWLLLLLYFLLFHRGCSIRLERRLILSAAGITFMVLLANTLSPGSRSRKSLAGGLDIVSTTAGLRTSLLQSVNTIVSGLTLVSLACGFAIAVILAKRLKVNSRVLRDFLALTVCVFIATAATDALGAYEPWHQIGLRLAVFMLGVLIGAKAGAAWADQTSVRFFQSSSYRNRTIVLIIGIWTILLVVQAALVGSIFVERSQAWDAGRAFSIEWIGDRDVDWIRSCAERSAFASWKVSLNRES